jgi:hypothetical protein
MTNPKREPNNVSYHSIDPKDIEGSIGKHMVRNMTMLDEEADRVEAAMNNFKAAIGVQAMPLISPSQRARPGIGQLDINTMTWSPANKPEYQSEKHIRGSIFTTRRGSARRGRCFYCGKRGIIETNVSNGNETPETILEKTRPLMGQNRHLTINNSPGHMGDSESKNPKPKTKGITKTTIYTSNI